MAHDSMPLADFKAGLAAAAARPLDEATTMPPGAYSSQAVLDLEFAEIFAKCQRRSKISPPGRSKTSPLNVMRYAVLGGCPGSP